jgi:hypothetical protein
MDLVAVGRRDRSDLSAAACVISHAGTAHTSGRCLRGWARTMWQVQARSFVLMGDAARDHDDIPTRNSTVCRPSPPNLTRTRPAAMPRLPLGNAIRARLRL